MQEAGGIFFGRPHLFVSRDRARSSLCSATPLNLPHAQRAPLRASPRPRRVQPSSFSGPAGGNAGSINATVGIAAPGSALNVVYLRDGREATTSLPVETLTEAPVVVGQTVVRAYGATLRDADGGAQVAAVEAGSPAAQAELAAGDVIRSVGGVAVVDARTAGAALQAASGSADLSVTRNGEALSLTLAL